MGQDFTFSLDCSIYIYFYIMRLNLKGRNAMIYFSDNELVELVSADVPYLDNTTFGLQIRGNGQVRFYPKKDRIVVSGMEECVRIARIFGLEV